MPHFRTEKNLFYLYFLLLFSCPPGCKCTGLAADCRMTGMDNFTFSENTKLLDISSNNRLKTFIDQYHGNLTYVSLLNMSFCGMLDISEVFLRTMRNLLFLDLRFNNLQVMKTGMFVNLKRLTNLLLDGNTEIHVIEANSFEGLQSLKDFRLTHVRIRHISKHAFQGLNFETVDISHNLIHLIDSGAFQDLSVSVMYLNETEILSFDKGMFTGLHVSNKLFTKAYKFCCIKPANFPEEDCYPNKDEFSSCEDLMRNAVLRSLLWVIGLFSLVGNAVSVIYRFIFDRERLRIGHGIFVSNLAIADFLMGIYLITIASADVALRGIYIYNDEAWRSSFWCQMAGVLSTISSEASVLFICLVTIDRIFVIKYPFGQIRFSTKMSILCSCCVWIFVGVIAIMPLVITSVFKEAFYSKTGVCLALPLTRDRPPGWVYSVCVFIGFNFVTFLAVAFGQWLIYNTITSANERIQACTSYRRNDLRVARNLLLVALTDFMCWFPIGVLGKY